MRKDSLYTLSYMVLQLVDMIQIHYQGDHGAILDTTENQDHDMRRIGTSMDQPSTSLSLSKVNAAVVQAESFLVESGRYSSRIDWEVGTR